MDEHKALYLAHLKEAVQSSWAQDDLEHAMDPLFKYFEGKLQDRKEQGKIVSALLCIVVDNKITSIQDLVTWSASTPEYLHVSTNSTYFPKLNFFWG